MFATATRRLRRLGRFFGLGRLIGLVLLAAFAVIRVWDPFPVEILRLKTFDAYQTVKPRTVTSGAVVVVDIDEKSLREVGQWPWPRTTIGELVARITEKGPAVIGFDVLFAEPDRLSPSLVVSALRISDPDVKAKLEAMPGNEAVFADALRRSRVVLGQAGHHTRLESPHLKSIPRTGFASLGGDPKPHLFDFPGLLHNLPELERAAAGRGLFTIRSDRDGIIRRVPAVMVAEGQLTPTLSIEMLRVATGTPSLLVKKDQAGIKSVVVGGSEIATDDNSQIWVYFSAFDMARFISAYDVLNGTVPADAFKGKLVLIGTSAAGLFDLRATPLDRVRPGVDIHAELIDSILTRTLLTRPHYALGAELTMLVIIGLIMVILVPIVGAMASLLLGAAIGAGLAGGSWYLFVSQGVLIDVLYPLLASLAIFSALTFTNYVREEMRRSQIRSAFAQYLSPDLVEQLTRDPDKLVLGGETRELTILFSDVQGFTAIAETYKSDPAGLTQLMNRLLTPLSNAIIERRGTIDKYMGDAIMAFWNAPVSEPDHARRACEAAIAMTDRLEALNRERAIEAAASGKPQERLRLGIGICTGIGIVGNMGSDLRFDYSVLGDSVNLASRLEGLTRIYGLPIVISAATAERGATGLAVLEVDRVRVKGKQDAETIHALLGGADLADDPAFLQLKELFAEFLERYRACNWDAAERTMQNLRGPADRFALGDLVALFEERMASFRAAPPPAGWDGVHAMQSK